MIVLKEIYPYVDGNNIKHENLVLHYAEDEKGEHYYIKQVETDIEYSEAIDVYPCRYTYEITDKKVEKLDVDELIQENIE